MPSPTNADANEIYAAMAALENAWQPFHDIATAQGMTFTSVSDLPQTIDNYIVAFRLPVTEMEEPYAANGLIKHTFEIVTVFAVGLASEDWAKLGPICRSLIIPFRDLYGRQINLHIPTALGVPTVTNVDWQKSRDGIYGPRDNQHYGISFPAVMTAYRTNPYYQ